MKISCSFTYKAEWIISDYYEHYIWDTNNGRESENGVSGSFNNSRAATKRKHNHRASYRFDGKLFED